MIILCFLTKLENNPSHNAAVHFVKYLGPSNTSEGHGDITRCFQPPLQYASRVFSHKCDLLGAKLFPKSLLEMGNISDKIGIAKVPKNEDYVSRLWHTQTHYSQGKMFAQQQLG